MQIVAQPKTESMDMQLRGWRNIAWSYYGKLTQMHDGPQAFLVNLPENGGTVPPHFHDVDQFQVIVRGGGRFGKDPVGPIAFHYADAFTPYGPIVGAEDGISFFTLRAACAAGHFAMPGSRHLMPGKPGRNRGGSFALNQPAPAAGQCTRETLLFDAGDGVEVTGIRMGASALANGEPADAGAQYYVVCSGSLLHEGTEYPRLALIHVPAGEPAPRFQAGADGADVLMLQLPRPSDRPGSNPALLAARKDQPYAMPEGTVVTRK